MTVTVSDIIEQFPELLRLLRGEQQAQVSRPSPPSDPAPGCILFLNKSALIEDAVSSEATVLVIRDADADHTALDGASQTVLQSPSPELALALVARAFFPITANKQGFDGGRRHPTAVISETAAVADDVIVGPNAVIDARVRIGEGSIVGPNTTIEPDVVIGDRCHIHANVFIAHGTLMGNDCEVHPMSSLGTEGYGYAQDAQFNHYRHVHYGRLIIEDDVHIGSSVNIDRGHFADSVIGRGTKIDNHCHLAHNIRIGRNCLITAGFITAGTVSIGNNNAFGGRSGVIDHTNVGSDMQFAALSSIFKDIDEPGGQFGGVHPIQPVAEYLRSYACIPHLPRLRKNVNRIMRKLGME